MACLAPNLVCLNIFLAGISYGHGAYHDVVASLGEELGKNLDDAALHFELAEAHVGHDEWRACLGELVRVEALAPGVYPTGFLRGLALHTGGKEEDAKKELDGFLSANPNHVNALATRGRVLMKLGKPADAAVDLQKAVELSAAKHPEMVVELANCYVELGKPLEASKSVDAALKLRGDDTSLLRRALEIETEAGAWDAALGRMDALQKTAPRKEPWMARRAELLSRASRTEDARAAWAELRDHLLSLPNLERGTPQNTALLAQARKSLGEAAPTQVVAPPAP